MFFHDVKTYVDMISVCVYQELLREVYQDLQDSCEGLLQFLMETKTSLQGFSTPLFLSITKTQHLPIELHVYHCSIMDQYFLFVVIVSGKLLDCCVLHTIIDHDYCRNTHAPIV